MTLTSVAALWVAGGLAAGAAGMPTTTHMVLPKQAMTKLEGPAAVLNRQCARALKRMRLEYRSIDGPYGGCRCIASSLERDLVTDQYQAAIDTFLTAVIARKASDQQLPAIRARFAKIRDFHSLTPASYRVVVRKTVSALQGCG